MSVTPDRRTLFVSALGLAAAAPAALAQPSLWPFGRRDQQQAQNDQPPANAHGDHMDHMNHGAADDVDITLSAQEVAVLGALSNCSNAGEVCLGHCIELMAGGEQSMAGCARSVREMLAVCRAAQGLVSSHSSFAGAQLALCRDACEACRGECQPHAMHHEQCRACAEACQGAIAAIDALLA